MARSNLEVKVGIFVFMGLTALCVMIIMFGFKNVKVIKNTYRLTAVFSFTNGVILGAPVRFSGVEVGKVDKIEFATDGSNDVYLHMSIRQGIVIRKDVRLIINSLGVLGETYLEFMPKSSTALPYQAGDKVRGEDPIALADVVSEGLKLVSEFRSAINDVLSEDTRDDLKKIVQNIEEMTGEETRDALKNSLSNIANLTGEDTRKKLYAALSGFEDASEAVHKAITSLNVLVEENRDEIKLILKRWKEISKNIQMVTAQLNQPKGTLGMLLTTPALHDSLHQTITNFSEWVTMIRKYGLLYKDKDVDKEKGVTQPRDNRGYFFKRK